MLTIERVEQLIASSRSRGNAARGAAMILAGMGFLLAFLLLAGNDTAEQSPLLQAALPLIMLMLIVPIVLRRRRERRQSKLMMAGFEAVQLRQWDTARDALTSLLQKQISHPRARTASLLALAAVVEADQNFDASQHIYETVLSEEQGDPLQIHSARVALVAAMFRTGQVADAVSLCDQLGRIEVRGPLKAQIELLTLFREVVMGQSTEALKEAKTRRDLFQRYLGTRAGFGYGLLAAAYDRAGREEDARREWDDATLLVRPDELTRRFSELEEICQKYPAAEWPF